MTRNYFQHFHDFPEKKFFQGFFMTVHDCGNHGKSSQDVAKRRGDVTMHHVNEKFF